MTDAPFADWERVGACAYDGQNGEPTPGWISTWRLRVPGGWLYRIHEQARDGHRFEPTEIFVPAQNTPLNQQ
jgi:hypothetical protein